ncbi:MAG: double-strand break repair protein AddB [Pseudomonadota bacterium]|nr:double-strand break repair protein AddB [Pseudomonadota bacterium]
MSTDANYGVFYISAGTSFVDQLARGIVGRFGAQAHNLSDIRIFLPTRRACRAFAESFLRVTNGEAALLPNMVPIGDIDEEELSILSGEQRFFFGAEHLPPVMPTMRRQLLLANMIMAKESSISVSHAARLASELSKLLDEVQTERLSFEGLGKIVPERFSVHWQEMLAFLNIVTEHWPEVLQEQGCIDPADRQNRLIEAQILFWENHLPCGPVIVAGTTGTIPATADLITSVAKMKKGVVVLPGLDPTLDNQTITSLAAGHPQYGLVRLLNRLNLQVNEVARWDADEDAQRRAYVINQTMRPTPTLDSQIRPKNSDKLFDNLTKISCSGPQQEALTIAMMLRQVLEETDKTAALITPDRSLARRVAAELKRWKIDIDDSGGTPITQTLPGTFLLLTAEAITSQASPIPLLAALKHPLAAGGLQPSVFRKNVREMELSILRGPRPRAGFTGLHGILRKTTKSAGLISWFEWLSEAAEPLSQLLSMKKVSPEKIIKSHITFAETLASSDSETGPTRLWAGEAGKTAAEIINEIRSAVATLPPISGAEWPALLRVLLSGGVVRAAYGQHPRLHIWGLLEARLQQSDLTILGGLNEGIWPPESINDPWMSRPMRESFGLAPPERRIGLTGHDFVQAVAAPKVVVTRSMRMDGTPTVQARWVTRIETFLSQSEIGQEVLTKWRHEEAKWANWQSELDSRHASVQMRAPEPRPPISARPNRLSVTEIETLIRDPYEIYAKRILGLRAIEPIDADAGAAERGIIIHRAVDRFFRREKDCDRSTALEEFLRIGKEEFERWLDRPGIWAFWWPRFERIANWIIEQEYGQHSGRVNTCTEVSGELLLRGSKRQFKLTARADRIDILADGSYIVIDYKTGALPTKSDVNKGLSPQLILEAMMIMEGAFPDLKPNYIKELSYWKLSGGDPPGYIRAAGDPPAELIKKAMPGLLALLDYYEQPDTPYLARPDVAIAPRYSDYDHLERVQEWRVAGD